MSSEPGTALIVGVALATLLASFLCSLLEAALYAVSPSQVELLRVRGVRGARRLARLRDSVEEPIAAILTVNTVAHTVGAAWCGALVGERFGGGAVGLFAAAFTVLVLLLTEIVPKSLGVRFAVRLAPLLAPFISLLVLATWPVVRVVKLLMRGLSGGHDRQVPSEEEVVVLSGLAARGGTVRADEHRWVRNALELDRRTAGQLRTPRTVVESLDGSTRLADLASRADSWVHSRVPVTEGDHADRVIGLAHRREVLDALLRDPEDPRCVADLMHPIRFVPETLPAHRLLETFLDEQLQLVAVVDEYGGFEGVVSLEDVLEHMLGSQIVDENDRVADLRAYALQRGQRLGPRPVPRPSGERPRVPA